MLRSLIICGLVLTTCGVARAQEPAPPAPTFSVEAAEYTIAHKSARVDDVDSIAELRKLEKAGSVKSVDTFRVSVRENLPGMAQAGRRVPIEMSRTSTGSSRVMRSVQMIEIGTMLKATVVRENGQLLLALTYESSRLIDQDADTTTPVVGTQTIDTTVEVQLGEPLVIGAQQGNEQTTIITVVVDAL